MADDKLLKPPTVKPADLGYLDPRDTASPFKDGIYHSAGAWIKNVQMVSETYQSPYQQVWALTILQTLPLTLRGDARLAYDALPHGDRLLLARRLQSWSLFVDEFRPTIQEREMKAMSYTWDYDKQTARSYTYNKMSLLQDYLPNELAADLSLILGYVCDRMDNRLAENIKAHRHMNPFLRSWWEDIDTLDKAMKARKKHIKDHEHPKALTRSNQETSNGTKFNSGHKYSKDSYTKDIPPQNGLAMTYNPDKISFDSSVSLPLRTYECPDGRVMRLREPCQNCGTRDHFRFECEYIQKSSTKVHFLTTQEYQDAPNYNEICRSPTLLATGDDSKMDF